ncbi:transcription factor Spi-C isoform X2 [Hemicordylus capensis]|uniref:transcription factor Spi-C isoform X2 n=1 Tax=Hemicordylus capensis TaxID=884348 RepID=UPI0023033617|nr:transcription factor Spi-C isoform X2 [Hemicordylus capensis]
MPLLKMIHQERRKMQKIYGKKQAWAVFAVHFQKFWNFCSHWLWYCLGKVKIMGEDSHPPGIAEDLALLAKMNITDQDILGQALEDALEVLQYQSEGDLNYVPDYKNCPAYHHLNLQANSSYLAESSTEKPIYSWKNAINIEDLYQDGAVYHTLQTIPENKEMCTVALQQRRGKGRKKLRLFEYLHESLQNPDMANCIQWIDEPNGVFQFVSKNKEKLAEQWGERKGNRKVMTYQKMARALRNYSRTGEILKIRRKLTYQFGAVVLQRLSPVYFLGKDGDVDRYAQDNQEVQHPDDWFSYHYHMYNNSHELQQASSNAVQFCYES